MGPGKSTDPYFHKLRRRQCGGHPCDGPLCGARGASAEAACRKAYACDADRPASNNQHTGRHGLGHPPGDPLFAVDTAPKTLRFKLSPEKGGICDIFYCVEVDKTTARRSKGGLMIRSCTRANW